MKKIVMGICGKTIAITGGTSGVGLAIVRQLQVENRVLVIARDQAKLKSLSDQFEHVTVYSADFRYIIQVEAVARQVVKDFPAIDILINNAAMQATPKFTDTNFDFKSIEREVNVNLTSVCCLCSLLLPSLLKESQSAIVNINSGLSISPKASSAVYCGSKAGLDVFSRSLRLQLADSNVSVLQAFLSLVDTPMTAGRGNGKMTAEAAAKVILHGVEKGRLDHDIGKVKLLRFLSRLVPSVAARIMRNA